MTLSDLLLPKIGDRIYWRGETWQVVAPPARKADYPYKHLMLLDHSPGDQRALPEIYIAAGEIVQIRVRKNAKDTGCCAVDVSGWGAVRIVSTDWHCPCCGASRSVYLPESWIDEGKAVFVERV